MSTVAGIGIDLTQHVPLVTVALCPAPGAAALASHWPPKVELRGQFRPQPPVALLPVMPGEPLLVGDAAASHRRSAGFAWPPESQVPFDNDSACGVARIPLVAAWTALLPHGGMDEAMTRREDHEFKWCPDGREQATRAGDLLARSIKSFLTAAKVPVGICWTAIVVPDALDEAGQQILLDSLAAIGISPDHLHLLPRPLAVALNWCQNADGHALGIVAGENEDGSPAGRVRVLTLGFDVWEAQSFELRARRYNGRTWIVPIRDRARLAGALPEVQTLGVSFALALARAESNSESFGWWSRLFADDWLNCRLAARRDMTQAELQLLREVRSPNPPQMLQHEFAQIFSLQPLWSRLFRSGPPLIQLIGDRWQQQEQRLSTSSLHCRAVLADGAFARLRMERSLSLASLAGNEVEASNTGHEAAARGAALAAAAIGHGLPCYRESLLPLDLYSIGRTQRGDPQEVWQQLVLATTVEAGREWTRAEPVEGLALPENKNELTLMLRRQVGNEAMFRDVKTAVLNPQPKEEPVSIQVSVRPGQGYARVRVNSKRPGLFTQLLDWRTMARSHRPEPPKLAYPPGVGVMEPAREREYAAEYSLRRLTDALRANRSSCGDELATFIQDHLGRYQFFDLRGHDQVFHGLVSSDGKFSRATNPRLFEEFQQVLGERFEGAPAYSELRDKALRAAGWLYSAAPTPCLAHLRQAIREYVIGRGDEPSQTELHAIGLCFSSPPDIRDFHRAFLKRFSITMATPNEWLRAIRNIVQFREMALSDDCISSESAKRIVVTISTLLREETNHENVGQKFINCIRALPFILKRRRYDQQFLKVSKDNVARSLDSLLEEITEPRSGLARRLPSIHRQKPSSTLRFLREEATMADTVVVAGD
jgi:hypothetical protein